MTTSKAHTTRFWFFLIVSAIGLVTAWIFNGLAVMQGAGVAEYQSAWFTSTLDWVLSIDLLIVAVAGSAFIILEGRRLGMRYLWAYILASGITAFAFTFPLFLAMRERALARKTESGEAETQGN